MFPKWSDWDLQYTRKGFIKKQARGALNILLLASVIIGAYSLGQQGIGAYTNLQGLKHFVRRYLRQGLVGISGMVNWVITMLPE